MTGKHYAWHKAWRREASGHLLHSSGLRVLVEPAPDDPGATDLVTDDASLAIWQASETSRGVPVHDLTARLQRLLKEATRWHQQNP